jgi:hypothetical protein
LRPSHNCVCRAAVACYVCACPCRCGASTVWCMTSPANHPAPSSGNKQQQQERWWWWWCQRGKHCDCQEDRQQAVPGVNTCWHVRESVWVFDLQRGVSCMWPFFVVQGHNMRAVYIRGNSFACILFFVGLSTGCDWTCCAWLCPLRWLGLIWIRLKSSDLRRADLFPRAAKAGSWSKRQLCDAC